MKTIAGQELGESDYRELRAEVDRLLFEMVYEPVVDLVRPSLPPALRGRVSPRALEDASARELRNAGEAALRDALRAGTAQLLPDPTGESALFSVAKPDRRVTDGLKSFGCRLNRSTGLWQCPPGDVPAWVRVESQTYSAKMRAAHEAVKRLVDDLAGKVDELVDAASLAKGADHAITEVGKGAWKVGAKQLEASWDLGPAGQQALAAGFEESRGIRVTSPGTKVGMVSVLDESTKREVKSWAAEALQRLRAEVEANAEQGFRAEGLAERIRNEYGVSKGRADLIARQETSNFMANYRRARAADAGLKRYQWYCVRDAKTRKDHLALHGRVFYYSRPPVTDTRTGARNNPGQDFRCRCTDRPVIE